MWFSRLVPTLKGKGGPGGTLSGQPAATKWPPAASGNVGPVVEVKGPLLVDVKDVPIGSYLAFKKLVLPPELKESFVVLELGDASATILVAPEAHGTHPQFELVRRLRLHGLLNLSVVKASREIIRTVHSGHERAARDGNTEDTTIEAACRRMWEHAVELKASDIHIETRSEYAQVFFRINNERVEQPNISIETATDMCNVLYSVQADADSKGIGWNPKIRQDAVIEQTTKEGVPVQLRFSSKPIHPAGNFLTVMRVLVMEGKSAKPLPALGYTPSMVEVIDELLIGQGAVLLVGPMNCGKSTTMQAMGGRLREQRGATISLQTVEAPVEYVMPGACQSSVATDRDDADFTKSIEAMLRQDPDGVFVGEVRDNGSATAVKNLALVGKKLVSTLHAFDPFAAFPRLMELGIPPGVLFMPGFIAGIISQRLVRVLCRKCSLPVTQGLDEGKITKATFERVLRVADLQSHDVRVRGCGCAACNGTGIVNRTLCASILVPTPQMLAMLANGDLAGARRVWQSNTRLDIDGLGVSEMAHAVLKMRSGDLDPSHIEQDMGLLVIETPDEQTSFAMNGDAGTVMPLRARSNLPRSLRT